MKPKSFRNFIPASLVASAILSASHAHAAILYYDGGTVDILTDGNSAASATSGNWDTTLLNWDAGASAHVAWNNANNDTAFFNAGTAFAAPTPGTVTLTAPITVGGITFNTSGYTIATNTLTLGGTNNTVALNHLATAATISSAIGTSSANMTFTAQNPTTNHTLTLGAAGGWTGTTTVNPGLTLQLNSASTALLNSTGVTLNGGSIIQNYVAAVDRINDTAAIASTGGTFATLSPNSAIILAETIGSVTLSRGLTTFVHNASQASLTSQNLILSGLTRTGATNTSAVNFASSGGLNITKNLMTVTGATATTAGQIVGPWATTGNTGGANDYATYDASSRVVPAAIAASAESSWTTAANAFTMNAGAGVTAGSAGLTGTRTITALRNISTTTAVTADSLTDEITLASHAYSNGDALIFAGTAVPGGLTAGTLYFVRDAAAGVFKVAATSGGAAIDLTSDGTAVTTRGALTLNSGANLETYGLLNGASITFNIAQGTGGVLTTPTGGGYLHLNAGNGTTGGTMTVSAPVTDNSGTVSVVKSGLGTLNLTGTNTFSGGIVVNSGSVVVTPSAANTFATGAVGADIINGGNLTYSSANAWGGTGRDATFNGTGTLTSSVAYTGGTLTVNSGANAVLANTGNLAYVTTTGTGAIIHTPGNSSSLLNLGSASGFTGNLQNRGTAGATATGIQFSSLGDGGALQFAGGNSDGNQAATFTYNGTSALTFSTRQIQILERVGGNNDFRDNILANNSADAAHTWTINTDLLATAGRAGPFNATGTAQLVLSGTNTGNNAFNGVISDGQYGQGANGNIGLTKSAAGKWIVAGNNTYSGPTAVNAGILNIQHANALGSTASGTTVANAARVELQGGITTAAEALTLTPGTGGNAMLRNISGINIWTGSITSNAGNTSHVSRIQSDADKMTVSGAVNLTGSVHQLVFQGDGTMEISGQITGTGRITSSTTGAGVRTLSNDTNSFTGSTFVNGGTLAFTSIANVGATNSALGAPVLADATIQLGSSTASGTLRYVGTDVGGHTSDRVINLASTTFGVGIEANGTGPLVLTATNTASGAGIKTFTLSGTNAGDNSIGAIINNSATNKTSVTKDGAGKWILTGANTYSGDTTVNTGTLVLADNAQLNFVLGATSGVNNAITGAGTVTLEGDFVIDTSAADALATGSWTLENVSTLTGPYGTNFTVSGFIDAGSNKWTKTNGATKLYTFDETTGVLTLGPSSGTPYDTWAGDKGLTGANNAKTDNPDNDGANNLGEFAFNGDPLSGADNGRIYVLTEDSDFDVDAIEELILTVAVRTGTPAFSGSPSPSANQASDGITYSIEGSLDLAGFPTTVNVVPTPVTTGLPAAGTGYEYRSFSLNGSNGLASRGFLRAKVTSP